MLMPLPELAARHALNLRDGGALHLGAHLAEEASVYRRIRVGPVWWVEANERVLPKIRNELRSYPEQQLIHALVWDKDGEELGFNVTNYDGMSSSVYEFGTHPQFSPDTVYVDRDVLTTTTVDSLVREHGIQARLLSMDLQGAEGPALRGAREFLAGVDYVITEVNQAEVYVGCTQIEELDELLNDFDRIETCWVPGQGWGDAIYRRRS